jgi:UDP-N-acetylglucosamine 2-epimerase (non-hydrolysing)
LIATRAEHSPMLKILIVAGTRPNFVKVAPLVAEMRRRPSVLPILVHTGQHFDREMSECFLEELRIPAPDFALTPRPSASVPEMTPGLRKIMRSERPDIVLVVGDVNSTLAGAEAAASLEIPVAHVEAGLRSFDPTMPEEANRIATDALSSLLFASEPSAVANLIAEGCPRKRIFLSGNVMIDTLAHFLAAARRSTVLQRLGLADESGVVGRYILATLHRAATVDDPAVLRRVWGALEEVATEAPVIFPVHPRTQSRLRACGLGGRPSPGGRIQLTGPLPYLDFIRLESAAALVMTDSGGVQEETTAMRVPCLTLRNNTERPITVDEGTNHIAGLDPVRIVSAARRVLREDFKTGRIPRLWDGRSAPRIVSTICNRYGARCEPVASDIGIPSRAVPAAIF